MYPLLRQRERETERVSERGLETHAKTFQMMTRKMKISVYAMNLNTSLCFVLSLSFNLVSQLSENQSVNCTLSNTHTHVHTHTRAHTHTHKIDPPLKNTWQELQSKMAIYDVGGN